MAVKRIFQLAKDLGVDSKDMVRRCIQEEIPNITNHMSVVSVGLEATLRDWFSSPSGASEGAEAAATHAEVMSPDASASQAEADSSTAAKSKRAKTATSKAAGQSKASAPFEGHARVGDPVVPQQASSLGTSAAPELEAKPSSPASMDRSSATTNSTGTGVPETDGKAEVSPGSKNFPLKPANVRGPILSQQNTYVPVRRTPGTAGTPQVFVDPTGAKAKPITPTIGIQASSSISTTPPASMRQATERRAAAAQSAAAAMKPPSAGPLASSVPSSIASTQIAAGPASSGASAASDLTPAESQPAARQAAPVNIARSSISQTRPSSAPIPKAATPPPPSRIESTVARPPTALNQPASSLSSAARPAGRAPGAVPTSRVVSADNSGRPGSDSQVPSPRTDVGRGPGPSSSEYGAPGSAARSGQPQPVPTNRVTPAPMNVPLRPTGVSPAGPKLETRTKVTLSGPKVVRIEAPEQVQAPRPRRVGPTGPGTGAPRPGGAEDDRNRSPRRRDAVVVPPGAKRSSGTGVPERRRGRSDSDWTGAAVGTFSETDLIEREERLARAGGFLKKRKQDAANKAAHDLADQSEPEGRIRIAAPFTIKDLSAATGVKGSDIVKKLFMQGIMKKINDAIEVDRAIDIMIDFDIDLEVTQAQTAEEVVSSGFEKRETKDLRHRGPVVTILGHVDHGKTSLLDKIRNTNVAAGEAGGITQKTSAFIASVEVEGNKKDVVFLDTPGHEAFTSMRSRGAKMTDVVVLVVSAPEGVMPQTIESINHAKAAKVPIVVALNKIDRPDATDAQIQKTLGQLASAGLNPTEWGGDTEVIRTSATTGQGITQLLEVLDYQSQLLDLKADFEGAAQGTVIESKMEEGRGAVASLLLQQGRLKLGDFVVMGRSFGRVRDITDGKGKRTKEASPPSPVQISGIDEICDAGDKFYVVDSLKKAQEAADQRRVRERQLALAQPKVTLDNILTQITDKEVKEILVVLKTDQQGTVDVLKGECEKVKSAEVKVRVLHSAVGGITESDILLADASRAIVIGFNVIPSGKARQLAEQKGVEIRTYQVIYDITDDLRKAAEGMLAPELREEILGHAEVRQVFRISKVGSIAGCYITDGVVQRDAFIRVTRNGVVVENDRKLSQLKRLKDDAKDVRAGMECGMKIDGYDDIKEGDVLECYKKIEVKRTL